MRRLAVYIPRVTLFLAGIVVGTFLVQPSAAQDKTTAANVVADVAKAIGTDNLKSIQYSGGGFMGNNSCRPGGPWPELKLTSYTRVLDYEKVASREDFLMTQGTPPCGAGFQAIVGTVHEVSSLNGDFAWTFGGPGPDNPPPDGLPSPGAVEGRRFEMVLTPHGWVKAAITAKPTMETKSVDGQQLTVISFLWNGKRKVSGYVNAQNLLVRTETWTNSDIEGDLANITTYSGYKDFSGIKFPTKIVRMQCYGNNFPMTIAAGEGLPGCRPEFDLTVTSVQVNLPTHIDVPDSIRNAVPASDGARPGTQSQKLADGIWAITVGAYGYQSVAIEFKDYSVVWEASNNEARSLAVIAETKRLIPNKPIKYVVNSHHHLDHAGGLRTFVAEGATIITQEINKPYFEQLFQNPHTLAPDKLAKNPRPATFLTVKDKYVLTDGTRSMEIYRHQGQKHDEGMVMIYMPTEKMLIESDAFILDNWRPVSPGSHYTAGMGNNLLDNIQRLKLDVQQVVPVHSFPGTFVVSYDYMRKRIAEHGGSAN